VEWAVENKTNVKPVKRKAVSFTIARARNE
jgi:hypothetical protein